MSRTAKKKSTASFLASILLASFAFTFAAGTNFAFAQTTLTKSLDASTAILVNPTIIEVYPSKGGGVGGTEISIYGSDFDPEATVTIGGAPCVKTEESSDTNIRCLTPGGTLGAADVVVANSIELSATLAGGFTYVPITHSDLSNISARFGERSETKTVDFTNATSSSMSFAANAVSFSGTNSNAFSIVADDCSGKTIASTATCSVSYFWEPKAPGSLLAYLDIEDNTHNYTDTVGLFGMATVASTESTWAEKFQPRTDAWQSIASSSDGQKLAAVSSSNGIGGGGSIYTSDDAGQSWSKQDAAGTASWKSIASSSDGSILIAASATDDQDVPGFVSIFKHSGPKKGGSNAWVRQYSLGEAWWQAVASSADGTKLAAVSWVTGNSEPGSIYTSDDSGDTWTRRDDAGSAGWQSITMSADGTRLAAVSRDDTGGIDNRGFVYTSIDSGKTWTKHTDSPNVYWGSITSSADGTKLAAVSLGDTMAGFSGSIYTSDDSGDSWTRQSSAGHAEWTSVTSSLDGIHLAAVSDGASQGGPDGIYTSDDSGVTWVKQTVAPDSFWASIASSADGTGLAAVAQFSGIGSPGGIYTSADTGQTWDIRSVYNELDFKSVAVSSDGTVMAGVTVTVDGQPGQIYTSRDSGENWVMQSSVAPSVWTSIASSADGTKLVAVSADDGQASGQGHIYTSSDSGETWTQQDSAGASCWQSVTSSADGFKLAAVSRCGEGGYNFGNIYTSSNSGETWQISESAGTANWSSIASSADGTKLVATSLLASDEGLGSIFTSNDSGDTWSEATGVDKGQWVSVTSSADGVKLAAVLGSTPSCCSMMPGLVFTSSDSGKTWVQQVAAPHTYWSSIASSADGTRLVASSFGYVATGAIYTSSDSGATWFEHTSLTNRSGNRGWSVAISADGSTLVGGTSQDPQGSGGIWTSIFAQGPLGAVLSASTPSIPNTHVGTTSVVQTETITNIGNGTISLAPGAVSLTGTDSGDFEIVSNSCTDAAPSQSLKPLAPNGTCTVGYTFRPEGVGPRTANLEFANLLGDPYVVVLNATATPSSDTPAPKPVAQAELPTGRSLKGATVDVVLTGLDPLSEVKIFARSTPVLIAQGFADAYGEFRQTVSLPENLHRGDHSIVATVLNTSGVETSVTVARFLVTANKKIAPAPVIPKIALSVATTKGQVVVTIKNAKGKTVNVAVSGLKAVGKKIKSNNFVLKIKAKKGRHKVTASVLTSKIVKTVNVK